MARCTHLTPSPRPYVPGSFFERELPCLLPLVRAALAAHAIDTVIVDGYVDLGAGRPGLGRHLLHALGAGSPEVVGVAKTRFQGADAAAVLRGSSSRPLWVTASGDLAAARSHLRQTHGEARIPDMLKLIDRAGGGTRGTGDVERAAATTPARCAAATARPP